MSPPNEAQETPPRDPSAGVMMQQMTSMHGWALEAQGKPLVPVTRPLPIPGDDQVRVRVIGSGVCHTDVGFVYEGVRTRHELPLILGHEVAGIVEATGESCSSLFGEAVVVPAVMPCGECELCRRGRGSICKQQYFPGNDGDGGFATHIIVPARGLARVSGKLLDVAAEIGESGVGLAEHAVIADAVSTAYQAVHRSGLKEGELAVFVGSGGVGGFGVQIAATFGAVVVAVDIDSDRLHLISQHGASLALDASDMGPGDVRKAVREFARERRLRDTEWRIFETSGTRAGQETAFRLLCPGAILGVVGYTREPVNVRLSNLMAFDARLEGHWGCLPELYPDVLTLVREGRVSLGPFIERRPLSQVNEVLEAMRDGRLSQRIVLVPEDSQGVQA